METNLDDIVAEFIQKRIDEPLTEHALRDLAVMVALKKVEEFSWVLAGQGAHALQELLKKQHAQLQREVGE